MMKFKEYIGLTIVATIFFCSTEVNAQFRVMATPSLEIPIVFNGDPGYSPTVGFKIGGFYEMRRLSIGLSVGYQSFSSNEGNRPKIGMSSFELDADPSSSNNFFGSSYGNRSCDTCTYTEEYGKLTMIPIMIEWNQYLLKMDKLKISAGLNVGLRIYSYSHVIRFDERFEKVGSNNGVSSPSTSTQPELVEGIISTDKTDTRFNISPKIAFEYLFNDKFSFYIEPAFNIQSGAFSDFDTFDSFGTLFDDISNTPNSYTVDQMFTASIGIGVIYNFGHPAKVQKRIEETKKIMESEKIDWLPE